MATGDAARAEFIALGDALKRLPGELFETHDHPAALLEEATSASIRVWGWSRGPNLACRACCGVAQGAGSQPSCSPKRLVAQAMS